ncbi:MULTISPECIES: DNA primase large subunit PriL [Methanobrevibacter]|uniref:DNA primase large subunit PriL n=1 Tax=Methanobrevibacter TaxID=2172 RepID=UPI0015BE25BF|nr:MULTISPECIES: DNA primase large subunit PriL [Methanobrevibacter]MBS7257907.1 DNA primase large subunit PriL [Methanobrevibacter sp.]MCI7427485.1 DNA primase large subunit PriL [Methanobrevibacter sp.]MDD6777091.1 DNA primase large subunit PriL [Methanobacteriaceae archaeon]MDY3097201.1 DNA primase large subunit PriL [Methanobrevibacter sp.]
MAEVSYINPLSNEGKGIIRNYGDLNQIFDEDESLIEICTRTTNQRLSDYNIIPKSFHDLALKRIQWAIEKKNNKNFTQAEFEYLTNEELFKQDVVTFHILCQAIAIQFNLGSRETRLFVESQGSLILERLAKIPPMSRAEIIDEVLDDVKVDNSIHWKSLKEIVATKKLKLTDLLIDNGEIILQEDDFLNRFSDKFTDRNPERMYNILIGDSVKEQILSRLIMQKTEEYIKRIKEMSKRVEIHPAIIKIGEELKEFIPTEISKYNQYYAGSGGIYGTVQAGKLNPDAFPPCIKATVEGVSSGGRNDAIVLLLTSFASYARLYPRIFASEETVKVSDMDPDLTITENEILPLIFDAADNCTPPLFEDQPQEKINIISKLGFGMHDRVDINHEGETKWYTPMSCEKIKIHLPSLCHPDKSCKGINNPLSCYGRKKFQLDKQQKE